MTHTVIARALNQAVSLVKVTRPAPRGVTYVPSEWELDRRRSHPILDTLPGHQEGLDYNDLITLQSFFRFAASVAR